MKLEPRSCSDFLTEIVQGMCFYPCSCLYRPPDQIVPAHTLVVRPNMADFRLVCGRGGRQIRALQFLGHAAGLKVHLDESMEGKPEKREFKADPEFPPDRLLDLLDRFSKLYLEFQPDWRIVRDGPDRMLACPSEVQLEADRVLIDAFADLLWPWGYRNGCQIDLKSKPVKLRNQAVA